MIYDGAVLRSTQAPGHAGTGNALNVIEFSATAATLYGYNETTGFGFSRMAVDPNGVTVSDVHNSFSPGVALIDGFGLDMTFGGGFIFSTSGRMIDPIARTVVRTLPCRRRSAISLCPSRR